MPIHLPSAGRPHLARQFRRHLVLVTALLLLTLLLRVSVNIYTMGNIYTINTDALIMHDEESSDVQEHQPLKMVISETG